MMKAKILLAEDDASIGYILKENLDLNGYQVVLATDGKEGLFEFNKHSFDLCILDIMLPKLDGFSLAEKIRETNTHVPILFLTARSLAEDKLRGFKLGGDDYITKPFNFEELLSRVEVFVKRCTISLKEQTTFCIGKVLFDYDGLCLSCKGHTFNLTQKEADILKIFCDHPNIIIKRDVILNRVWGDNDYFIGRSLDVFIVKLRKYLAAEPSIEIQNIHGVGFRLVCHL
ncbi:MAG TPA: response regulator transcription factor [Cytophagaceae bacterium]|jgi:DNA-binding response OmpR family regulator